MRHLHENKCTPRISPHVLRCACMDIVVVFAPFTCAFPCVHICLIVSVPALPPTPVGDLPLRWAFALSLRTLTAWHIASDLKKNKAKFFLGLALKTCIEGNCIEKARFIAIKPVKSRVYGGCKNFHQFSQNKCLVCGMTLISRGHQFFK